jgi:hypothetical protein
MLTLPARCSWKASGIGLVVSAGHWMEGGAEAGNWSACVAAANGQEWAAGNGREWASWSALAGRREGGLALTWQVLETGWNRQGLVLTCTPLQLLIRSCQHWCHGWKQVGMRAVVSAGAGGEVGLVLTCTCSPCMRIAAGRVLAQLLVLRRCTEGGVAGENGRSCVAAVNG